MPLSILTPPVATPAKTTVWYTRCPVPNALGLALRAGKFDDEFADDREVELRSVLEAEEASIHDAHYYGTLQNALRLGGNVPPIWARSRGAETRLIGIAWTTAPAPILALKNSEIRTVADLKGKRLLVTRRPEEEIDFPYAGALRNYEAALATAGLTLNDVVLVEKKARPSGERSKPAPSSSADELRPSRGGGHKRIIVPLVEGEVDAIVAHGPAAVDLIDTFDLRVVHDLTRHADPIERFHNSVPRTLTIDAGFIDRRPDLVARLVARLLEMPLWAAEHHQEAVHFTALEQGVSDELIESTYGKRLAPELQLNLIEENVARIAAQKEFLLKHRFIANDFSLDDWIDARPLAAARQLLAQRPSSTRKTAPRARKSAIRIGPAGCVSR